MRKSGLHFNVLLLLAFVASYCSHASKENRYIGTIPWITAEYAKKISEYEQKADAAVELRDAYRYNARAKELVKKADLKIKAHWKELPKPVNVNFKQELFREQYAVKQIFIDSARYNKLYLSAVAEVKCSERQLFIYLRSIDSLGREISGSEAVLISSDHWENDFTKFTGIIHGVEKLSALNKFKIVSKTNYQQKLKIN